MSILDIFKKNSKTTIPDLVKQNKFLPPGHGMRLGAISNFSGTDSEESFEQNLKTQPPDWYYRTYPVRYTLNKHGYRTNEFDEIDWSNSVVIFGCSNVFGVGLDDKDTVSSQLSKIINRPVINMGVGGSSMSHSLHNSIILRNGYSMPKGVVHIWSDFSRTVYYRDSTSYSYGSWNIEPGNYGDNWNEDKHHSMTHALLASITSQILWKDTNYYEASYFEGTDKLLGCDSINYVDYARDLCHPGIKTNHNLAVRLANKLQL
jgi:hypothetical protein